MYKLLLVSDKEDIRRLYAGFSEWEKLGFEKPAIAENAQEGITLLRGRRFDAVSSLLSVSEGKQFFAFLSRRPEMLGMETARDEARLRREISSARRTLSSKDAARQMKQVDDLTKERDEARRQITARDFTAEVGKLASAHKFDNPEYLEYLITKKQLDLKDEAAVSQFFKELETSVPSHFQSDAHPGSGSGPGKETSSNAAAGQQRIKELLGKKELSMIEVSELIRLQNGQSQPPADSNQPKPE